MADPFQLSVQYQDRLNRSTEALDRLPDSFMAGMKIPAIQAQNRILKNQAIESDQRISANDQLMKMMDDPGGFARQFGELSSAKDMRKFMANHAAIVVSPLGEKIMNGFDRIATATEQAEIHSIDKQLELATAKKRAEFLAGAIDAGIDPQDAEALRSYQIQQNKSRSLADFERRANAAGLNPYSVQFGQDAYDQHGNLDADAARTMLGQLTPSQRLVTQQEIADTRASANIASAKIRDDLAQKRITNETARLELQKLGFGLREIDQHIKASELGYDIQGGPDIPTTPGGVRLVQAERPPTTGTTTKLQQENFNARNALKSLGEAAAAIEETPGSIGVRGIVGSALEKAGGQLNPGAEMATPITQARQKASLAFSSVAKSLRVDSGNMSRYELNKLEQAGDVLDWTESAQTAQAKIRNLQSAVLGKELRNVQVRKAKPDDALLRQIPASEILGLISEGLLSPGDAKRWHKLE